MDQTSFVYTAITIPVFQSVQSGCLLGVLYTSFFLAVIGAHAAQTRDSLYIFTSGAYYVWRGCVRRWTTYCRELLFVCNMFASGER